LKGSKLGDFWRFDHGDYRIIVDIVDREILICVIRIGGRKDVCRGK